MIILRCQGRLPDTDEAILGYNEVMTSFVDFMIDTLIKKNQGSANHLFDKASSIQMISFFIAVGNVGDEVQLGNYA